MLAKDGSNQSERSKIFFNQSESSMSPRDPNDVAMPIFGHECSRDPMGKEHTETEFDPHFSHSFNDRVEPGNKRDVCEVLMTSRPFFYKSNK